MSFIKSRRALFTALLILGVSSGVAAGTPSSTGLGEAWPNAVDVSLNPHFHAYVFVLGGIQYIQINDLNGKVLGSVGTAGGQFIVLPIGQSSKFVSTPQQPASSTGATPSTAPVQVYNDGTTILSATPMSDGTTQIQAQPATAASNCDLITCSTHGA